MKKKLTVEEIKGLFEQSAVLFIGDVRCDIVVALEEEAIVEDERTGEMTIYYNDWVEDMPEDVSFYELRKVYPTDEEK